jgi:hypothetical protein
MVNGPGGDSRKHAPEQRPLPVLQTVAPRRREATPEGAVGMTRRPEQPVYVPQPLESRPFATEIA